MGIARSKQQENQNQKCPKKPLNRSLLIDENAALLCIQIKCQDKSDLQWLNNFQSLCYEINEYCHWSNEILDYLPKFIGYNSLYYRQVLNWTIQNDTILKSQKVELQDKNMVESDISYQKSEQNYSSNPKNVSQNISKRYNKLLKLSFIIEEDHEQFQAFNSSQMNNFSHAQNNQSQALNQSYAFRNQSQTGNNSVFTRGQKNIQPRNNPNREIYNPNKQTNLSQRGISQPNSMKESQTQYPSSKNNSRTSSVPSYLFPQNNIKKGQNEGYIEDLEQYILMTQTIKKHFSDKDCILNFLLNYFVKIFIDQYDSEVAQMEKSESLSDDHLNEIENAIYDLQQFIKVIVQTIDEFYQLQDFELTQQSNIVTRENLINFTTSIIFDQVQIYNLMFKLFYFQNSKQEQEYSKTIKKAIFLEPQNFEVPKQYCLNDQTLELIIQKDQIMKKMLDENFEKIEECEEENYSNEEIKYQKKEQKVIVPKSTYKKQDNDNKTNKKNIIPETSNNHKVLRNQQIELLSKHFNIQQFDNFLKSEPYYKCIKELRKIDKKINPLAKLRTILKTSENIQLCVKEYYLGINVNFTNNIDADDVLSIYNYIIAKSNVKNILTHCQLIEKFVTSNLLNSISGYYLTTIQVSLQNIVQILLK